jgi:hypothetical protein
MTAQLTAAHINGELEQDTTGIPFSSRLGAGRQDVWTIYK